MTSLVSSSLHFVILKIIFVITPWLLLFIFFRSYSFDGRLIVSKAITFSENHHAYTYLPKKLSSANSSNIIAILTRFENLTILGLRIGELDKTVDDQFRTPVIVFHQGYLGQEEFREIHRYTQRSIIFRNVDEHFSKFPAGFDPYLNQPNWAIRTKWGYHHMIHFWFKIVFELPEIQPYKYIMRLDYDSRLFGNWTNVFTLMKTNHSVYMANFETLDYEWQLRGTLKLKDLALEHIRRHGLVIQNPRNFERAFTNETARTYWNNFEIAELQFFRRENVTDWVNAVIESQGIYKYRWGDAILRFLTLAIFARDDQVLHRQALGLRYCHPC